MSKSDPNENLTSDQEKLMIGYLLGDLSEAEQMEFATQYFADEDLYEHLCAVETDLVDDYVRNELPAAARGKFEQHYLASPRRRGKMESARVLMALNAVAGELDPAPSADRPLSHWWQSGLGFLRQPRFAISLGLTIVLLILGAGVWLAINHFRLQSQFEQLRTEQARLAQRELELQQEVAQQRAQNNQLNEALERERNQHQPLTANPMPPLPLQPVITQFVLTPRQTRESGERKRLVIPPETTLVQFELALPSIAEYQRYRAIIRTVTGVEIWSQAKLEVRSNGLTRTIIIRVPVRVLAARDYLLTLSGITANGESEDVADYYFRIVKR